jgi:hypothetical protein
MENSKILFYYLLVVHRFFLSRFWTCRNKESLKTCIFFSEKTSGLITKTVVFFSSVFFSPSLVLLDFVFVRVFGRFVTMGVQTRD